MLGSYPSEVRTKSLCSTKIDVQFVEKMHLSEAIAASFGSPKKYFIGKATFPGDAAPNELSLPPSGLPPRVFSSPFLLHRIFPRTLPASALCHAQARASHPFDPSEALRLGKNFSLNRSRLIACLSPFSQRSRFRHWQAGWLCDRLLCSP